MNKTLRAFVIRELTTLLAQCSPQEQSVFRRMYAPQLPEGTPIADVLDAMPDNPGVMDWALTQVEKTLADKVIKALAQADQTARQKAVINSIFGGIGRVDKP